MERSGKLHCHKQNYCSASFKKIEKDMKGQNYLILLIKLKINLIVITTIHQNFL